VRVVPDFVEHPFFGRVMTLEGAMKDCADVPWLRAELMAQAAADEAALEAGEDEED
jgi:hypothetical protein